MHDTSLLVSAMMHVFVARTRRLVEPGRCHRGHDGPVDRTARDRGAVSIEQVLWYAAAAVSVAVIAAIIWSRIRDEANNTSVNTPSAP